MVSNYKALFEQEVFNIASSDVQFGTESLKLTPDFRLISVGGFLWVTEKTCLNEWNAFDCLAQKIRAILHETS